MATIKGCITTSGLYGDCHQVYQQEGDEQGGNTAKVLK